MIAKRAHTSRFRSAVLSDKNPGGAATSLVAVSHILVASDSPNLLAEVDTALHGADFEVHTVNNGPEVLASAKKRTPDLVIVDLQIDNMGGMAICLDLRLEASGGRLEECP